MSLEASLLSVRWQSSSGDNKAYSLKIVHIFIWLDEPEPHFTTLSSDDDPSFILHTLQKNWFFPFTQNAETVELHCNS